MPIFGSILKEALIQQKTPSAKTFLLLVLSLVAASDTAAQEDSEDRWNIAAELSLTDQSGNRALRLLTGGVNLSHLQREDFRFDAAIQSRYGRSEDELVTLSHHASLGFDLRPTSSWSPFASVDAERDEFKRLDVRVSTGAGAKYTPRRTENDDETSISLALLHSYERISPPRPEEGEPPVIANAESSHNARWSLRARTSHQIREGITLRHTTFYQPLWDDVANYLLRSDTGMKILLTERLALSVDYQLKRDARPPPGVEPDDRLFKTGLIIDF
ncbi:MAG: DUF481 domain-containing protein [Gemmatimonadota bacterium]